MNRRQRLRALYMTGGTGVALWLLRFIIFGTLLFEVERLDYGLAVEILILLNWVVLENLRRLERNYGGISKGDVGLWAKMI